MAARPRFTDIATDLQDGIRSGRYPVGSVLPNELALCSLYDTSRHTVRMALLRLQQLGLVSRRKNAGTRVESATPSAGFGHALSSMDDLVQFGAAHSRALQEAGTVVADAALAALLACAPGTTWQHLGSLRLVQQGSGDPVPLGWTDVYVRPGFEGLAARAQASPQTLISTLLERDYGQQIRSITQDVDAVALPEAVAHRLGVDKASAGLRVIRRYLGDEGETIEVSVTHHAAGQFAIRTVLTRP